MKKKHQRKTVSLKALLNTTTCSFHFTLFFDTYGYYIWCNSGNVVLCNHMKCSLNDVPFQLKNLSKEEKKHVGELSNAHT